MANGFVQDVAATTGSQTTTLQTAAPAASTTAGNLLVVIVSTSQNIPATGVTDSAGNTYTLARELTSATWWRPSVWYCFNAGSVASSTGWFRATTGTNADIGVHALEFSGLGAGSVSTSGVQNQSSSTSSSAVSTDASAAAGDLVVSGSSSQTATTKTPSGGFTDRGGAGGPPDLEVAYKLASGGGTETCTWSWSPSSDGGSIIVAFTPAAGGGGTTRRYSLSLTGVG